MTIQKQYNNDSIIIKGAKEHNLKNITVDIPRNSLTVITGVSGSGKSSLAFDTIYAEGQRRYVESLSAYARQFLELMQKPEVDSIEGLSPAISIEQKTTSKNPRSIVGTVTEIYDYMRLLWARVGIPYSPATGLPIKAQSISEIVDRIHELPQKTRLYILAPIVRGRKGEYRKEFIELRKKGFQRVKIDGTIYDIEDVPNLDKKIKHDIEVVVDRIILNDNLGNRLAESVETSVNLSDGLVIVEEVPRSEEEKSTQHLYSTKFSCPESGFTLSEIEPRLFSFNNPFGACPSCDGLGSTSYFDIELLIPDQNKSLAEGAIEPWNTHNKEFYLETLNGLAINYNETIDKPFHKLSKEFKDILLHGSGEKKVKITYLYGKEKQTTNQTFEGIIPNLERRLKSSREFWFRDYLKKFRSEKPCEKCQGYRLKDEALCVKIDKKHIGDITKLSILEAKNWFESLPKLLSEKENDIAKRILKEISERLNFLIDVGLDYLTLNRKSGSLSGGESQRIRLASQIGSGLTGVLYVLDEPSIGLHQRDNDRLLETLKHLKNLGNTVLVVEHDEDAILTADHILDMGPGAGIHGGNVIAQGTPHDILKSSSSLTGQYLSRKKFIPVPIKRRKAKKNKYLTLNGAEGHNLKNVSLSIPLGTFTCITGVSGSGKSTLIIDTLYQAATKYFNKSKVIPEKYKKIEGFDQLDKVIDIDQSPIGRTPRSNPATYTGLFGPIRDWFANLPESKARGYKPGRYSFNVKGGRCETCQGDGVIKIEMHFLPDIYVQCDLCKGKRYNRETLEVTYKGKSISDVLDMTVEEALNFFQNIPSIANKLKTLKEVGLDYIHLGQSATTLSGGEAQRVKLAKELSKRSTGKTLYILDEPTTGLHFEDINKLLQVLHMLVDQGNTIVIIEHNLDVIKTADWIVDLGPEGGFKGGEIIAKGTPEDIALNDKSYTGYYLKKYVNVKNKKAL